MEVTIMNFEKLQVIIAENLSCSAEDVKLESRLVEDLEADSLDVVELTMAIEEAFGVTISDDELEKIRTVEDILTRLNNA